MSNFERLAEFLGRYNLKLTKKQENQFYIYYEKLIETNKVMNLTAITEFEEVEEKHFIDSLAIVSFFDMTKIESMVDIGTGAGFPGVPLKIMFPHLKVVLADSLNKRVKFLEELVEELELCDIYAVHGRAEELARDKNYREQFDLCISRAVSSLPSLSELCLPLVKVGGFFVPYKTQSAEEELSSARNAITKLGGELSGKNELVFGEEKLHSCFTIVRIIGETPTQYPRKNGIPQKKPIL